MLANCQVPSSETDMISFNPPESAMVLPAPFPGEEGKPWRCDLILQLEEGGPPEPRPQPSFSVSWTVLDICWAIETKMKYLNQSTFAYGLSLDQLWAGKRHNIVVPILQRGKQRPRKIKWVVWAFQSCFSTKKDPQFKNRGGLHLLSQLKKYIEGPSCFKSRS